ncbi:hypothetical protein COCVIDRAFT_84559 [Bipolaris victoriae FI3]|uniref:Uncharacterized protein n=1 Tax=Bipolaris victoriae (strain FI3) TaxID=930091 RepID=W7FAT0_BIPV3|nr:hypothetical protein COCVIDRAFT_84559 [Bipolaris victoriae FI3]
MLADRRWDARGPCIRGRDDEDDDDDDDGGSGMMFNARDSARAKSTPANPPWILTYTHTHTYTDLLHKHTSILTHVHPNIPHTPTAVPRYPPCLVWFQAAAATAAAAAARLGSL